MSKKHTYEYIKQYFEDNGCELLENEYKNNRTKMRYRCSCGNISEIRFSEFNRGQRCFSCGIKRTHNKQRFSYEYVRDYFRKHNCILLSKEYNGCDEKLEYICSCGNKSTITFSAFKTGRRCSVCGVAKCSLKRKHSYEYVYSFFKDNGCLLLSDKYINANNLLMYRCVCGRESAITFANFQQGVRCMKCGIEKNSGANNKRWNHTMTNKERVNGRCYPEYVDWRNSVYERDNYTCQVCGDRGVKLNAHHIESFNNNPKLRIELYNGITLCRCCHNDFHHIYGRGNNTEKQFKEFLHIRKEVFNG